MNGEPASTNETSDRDSLPSSHTKKMVECVAKNHNFFKYNIKAETNNAKGENFFGEIYKVLLEDQEVNDKRMKLVLKMAPHNPLFRENLPLRDYFCREIDAYMIVLPELEKIQLKYEMEKFHYAKCFAANRDEYKESVLLEDLSDQGYRVYNKLISLDYQHTVLAIQNLARFHSTSFVMKHQDSALFDKLSGHVLRKLDYGIHFPQFLDQHNRLVLNSLDDPEIRDRLSVYLEDSEAKFEKLLDPSVTQPYNCICHGDCWTCNLLFKYEEDKVVDVKMIDWQVIRLGSPIIDLSYLILVSTDAKFRSVHFHNLLNIYYDTLKSNVERMGCDMNVCYPENVYREQIKTLFSFGLLATIVLCPVLLCDKSEIPDLADVSDKYKNEQNSNVKLTKTPKSRITDVINDCIKYEFM